MRKTCVCGNIMNDSIAPNDFVYYAFLYDEWQQKKKSYNDFYINIVIRDFWYCKICNRIYSRVPLSDNNYIFWVLDNNDNREKAIDICKEEHDLIELYVLNDKEDCDMIDIIENNQEIVLPRQVWYCKNCRKIFVKENGEIKVFKVDKIIPYQPKE